MDSVTVTTSFEGDATTLAEHCQSLESREAWPGSQVMGRRAGALMYMVGMRLKGAEITEIEIKETVGPLEQRSDGSLHFVSEQLVSWPDGNAHAEADYVIAPGSPSTLTFTYRYEPPGGKLVKKRKLPEFHEGMKKVAGAYVGRLAASASSG